MSFLSAPSAASADKRPADASSAAATSAALEKALADRMAPPDLEPVLAEIARVAAMLVQHPRVRHDAHAMHLLDVMALAQDMDGFERSAETLRAYLAEVPSAPAGAASPAQPAPSPRASRVLLRL